MVHEGPASGILEDFVVVWILDLLDKSNGPYVAYFTTGKEWFTQGLYTAISASPLGPFTNTKLHGMDSRTHTRIEKAVVDLDVWYGTAVYRRLPMTGIWRHENRIFGTVRQLLIPPKEGSLYSVSVCNPCLFKGLIFFEGRNQQIKWRIFQSDLDGNVHPDPICVGGNPFVTQFDDTIYLYFSKYRPQKGFDTWVMTQKFQ